MYDWTDDFLTQAIMSYPSLRYYLMQAVDMGDYEPMFNFLLSFEGGNA
jgi:hypothetical protein